MVAFLGQLGLLRRSLPREKLCEKRLISIAFALLTCIRKWRFCGIVLVRRRTIRLEHIVSVIFLVYAG